MSGEIFKGWKVREVIPCHLFVHSFARRLFIEGLLCARDTGFEKRNDLCFHESYRSCRGDSYWTCSFLFKNILLNIYYVPDIVLSLAVNRTDEAPHSRSWHASSYYVIIIVVSTKEEGAGSHLEGQELLPWGKTLEAETWRLGEEEMEWGRSSIAKLLVQEAAQIIGELEGHLGCWIWVRRWLNMRLEKAAGPGDWSLVGHGEAFGIFPKSSKKLLEVPLRFRISVGRLWNAGKVRGGCVEWNYKAYDDRGRSLSTWAERSYFQDVFPSVMTMTAILLGAGSV